MASTFSIDVSRWVAKAKGREDVVVRKVAIEAFRRVILKTPVKTGRARANWQCEIGAMKPGTTNATDPSGSSAINAATEVALKLKAGQVIFLANNLAYIGALERGHSKQAPAGMVAITAMEFNTFLKGAVSAAKKESA